MGANWALGLQQGPNPGERFADAFRQGQETARQNKARAAMAALVKDPNNAGALQALAEVDPPSAMQFRERQSQMAMQAAEQYRGAIMDGVPLYEAMGSPTDNAGWMAFKQRMAQTGHNVSQMPDQFDPTYIQGAKQIYQAWAKPQTSSEVVVTPQPGAPAYIYDKASGKTKQIVFPEGQAPKPLTDEDIARMEGGQSPSGSGGFPGPF